MMQSIHKDKKNFITLLSRLFAIFTVIIFQACNADSNNYDKIRKYHSKYTNQDLPTNTGIPNENIKSFLNMLADPKQDVHGVLLVAPDRHDKLVLLNRKLGETKPCYWNPNEILTAEKTPVPLPKECLDDNIQVLYDKQQILVITPAIMKSKDGTESIVFLSDLDHRVICTKPSGMPCR